MWRPLLLIVVLSSTTANVTDFIRDLNNTIEFHSEDLLKVILQKINEKYAEYQNMKTLAKWKYDSNLTNENLIEKIKFTNEVANNMKKLWNTIKYFPLKKLTNEDTNRQFLKIMDIEELVLSEQDYIEYTYITSQMSTIYTQCFKKEPKKLCEEKILALFPRYVKLGNKAAKLNNYADKSEVWLSKYDAKDFQKEIEFLWKELKPLYMQIHAYVRREMRKENGEQVSADDFIPFQLLVNHKYSVPFPEKKLPNVTSAMIAQGYNVTRMFKLAESAFVNMNMSKMPELFWKNSILEKPTDREIDCFPSAWNFNDSEDFRIKMCTQINSNYLNIIHHEMGHIQYFLQYKDQPSIYRNGANPGFHEAIGDMIALSVNTPEHLQKIKLLENYTSDEEVSLNNLYKTAVAKVFRLPFYYILDKWRWDIFRGDISEDQYNNHWWKLAKEYQGVSVPISQRKLGFNPGSFYHIASDIECLRYFVSTVLQFQFHRALCVAAKKYIPNEPETKPLHECDITDSKKAGNLIKSMMKLGSSKPWQDALELLTGERKMSSSGILEYFKPLMEWLTAENMKTNEFIGWKSNIV